jgi:PHP family Zn ribbon phosphoesterase
MFLYTIEVDPSYGKYHLDGHRNCGVRLEPGDSINMKGICPVCRKPLTIGVLHRVEELADRPEGFIPKNPIPYKSVMPLSEIISSVMGIDQLYSKKVWDTYNRLIEAFGSEFGILLKATEGELKKIVNRRIADAIIGVREKRIKIQPGFDGLYGKAVFGEEGETEMKPAKKQRSITDFG